MSLEVMQVVPRHEALVALELWQIKGHRTLDAIRLFELASGGYMAGISDYIDCDAILIPESMNRSYTSFKALFTAIGALLDELAEGRIR